MVLHEMMKIAWRNPDSTFFSEHARDPAVGPVPVTHSLDQIRVGFDPMERMTRFPGTSAGCVLTFVESSCSPCDILKPAVDPVLDALRNAQRASCTSVFLSFAREDEDAWLVYEQVIDRVL